MGLKTRFLLTIVGISFLGLALISVVAYDSAIDSEFQNEVEILGEVSEHLALMLKGKKNIDEIKGVLGVHGDSHYNTYLIDANHNIYPFDNNLSIATSTADSFVKGISHAGEHSGYLREYDAGSGNAKTQVGLAWHLEVLEGTGYSFLLLSECNTGEKLAEFLGTFGAPLITAGFVVLWISAWGALFLASLFKKLAKQAEELKEARDRADKASKAKSDFLAVMSHEMRTPLTAIIGFSETMLHHEQSKGGEDDPIETIYRTGKHLLHLINEILDLSKIEANKLEIEHINFSPLKLVLDIEQVFRPQTVKKNLTFDVHYDFPLPAKINSDAFRLKQILYNLYSNALKFTRNGNVGLNVSCDVNAQLMNFEVVDTGTGIKEESIGSVFQSFTQEDATISRKYGGTGLGLTLSKKLAELLGGTITVKSEVGVGSRFLVTISTGPLDNVEFIKSTDQAPKIDSNRSIEIPDLTGRVLLAEDNEDNQRLISLLIRKAGVEVILAANGEEAVEKALNEPVDLVFMDMQMPVMNGMDATRALREKSFSKPIVALTANTMNEDRNRCFSAGCNGFLGKPIDRRSLYKVLSEHLGDAEKIHIVRNTDIKADENNNDDDAPIKSNLISDPDFADIVEIFIKNLYEMQADIHHALNDKDWVELDSLCHQLKGSGGNIGFPLISEIASEIGTHIKERAYDQAQSEIERFDLVCDRIYAGADNGKMVNAI